MTRRKNKYHVPIQLVMTSFESESLKLYYENTSPSEPMLQSRLLFVDATVVNSTAATIIHQQHQHRPSVRWFMMDNGHAGMWQIMMDFLWRQKTRDR
jgi:hypothetical protein